MEGCLGAERREDVLGLLLEGLCKWGEEECYSLIETWDENRMGMCRLSGAFGFEVPVLYLWITHINMPMKTAPHEGQA